ncbi:MAG: hypothetical protein PF638_12150 [Candidatus Delongbacteria bacterium]|jgi:hypothetical protein|nr:hypothetical protein [Candidatus Delongbacteria bacterium]
MLFSSLISSLILIESREVGQGMLSQPFIISFLFIFLGYDPYYVLLTATATHLFFVHYIPSGASKYPEYPFAFFIVLSSSKYVFSLLDGNTSVLILFSFILIVIISRLTATYLYYKRKLLEKLTLRFIDQPRAIKIRHHLILSLTYSFISGIIYALILLFLSRQAFELFAQTIKSQVDINNLLIVILAGMFIPYFITKKKLKASSIGIVLGIIFFILKSQ